MPPNTHFSRVVKLMDDGTVHVSGTLEDPDAGEDPTQVVVFAFVTQHQGPDENSVKSVTLAGEARLYPVKGATGNQFKWWLATRDPANAPSHDDLEAAEAKKLHPPIDYALKKSPGWAFDGRKEGFSKGAAFGTAVSLTFKKDGTIETYAWSGWVEIKTEAEAEAAAAAAAEVKQ